jgi:hypothetical protein
MWRDTTQPWAQVSGVGVGMSKVVFIVELRHR